MALFASSLVIGGTGMLAEATTWLITRSRSCILIGRRASSFPVAAGVFPFDLDWNNPAFAANVCLALKSVPPIDAALLWFHEPGPILAPLLPALSGARIVLVLGSMDGRPAVPQVASQLATVRLGSMLAPHGRRWLTDSEISAAAIASLEDGECRVVGELTQAR